MEHTYHSHTDSVVSVNGIWINWHTNADLYTSIWFTFTDSNAYNPIIVSELNHQSHFQI